MAEKISKKAMQENLRSKYVKIISDFLASQGEEILPTKSNEFAFPSLDEEGEDEFVVVKITVPTGSRDGEAYDGYGESAQYLEKVKANEEKAKAKAEAKAKKIARDKAERAAKAKAKAEHEAEKAKGKG